MFYQLLTGEVPPADRSKWLPPSAKVQVDVRLDEIVLKALERMPERRYATATELRTALETMASAGGGKVPVLTPYRAPTANFSPVIPRGSRILVYRLASTFEPGDLVVFQQGAVAMLARVTRRGPVDGLLHVERKDGSDQLLMVGEVVGKVVLNTRESDSGAVRE